MRIPNSILGKFQDTLVLNSDGFPVSSLPISTIDWRSAFQDSYLGKVDILHSYSDWTVRSEKCEYLVPAVILIKNWVKIGRTVNYSRINIYTRDNFTCQYCNDKFDSQDLTLDHVVPKSMGGKSEWRNITSCCVTCNTIKADDCRGWLPTIKPHKPTYGQLVSVLREIPIEIKHASWNYYLGWPDNLVSIG